MKRYSPFHQWIEMQHHNIAKVGISSYAAEELGEVVYVELPKVDSKITLGEEVVILESTKAATDISTPLSGKVVEINANVLASPKIVSESPEGEGWLFKIEMHDPKEVSTYLNQDGYLSLVQGS